MMDPGAMAMFLTGTDDIYVDKGWKPKVGQPVPHMPGCYIGKRFGHGALAMNSIFDVADKDGRTVGQALKVCKQTRSARRSLAHEWKMFKDLMLVGEDYPAARSHFLQAHRVLKQHDGSIAGIIMEKANGQNVIKTLKDPKFCNVRYVIALLRDLLVALDVAQRVLGFAHYDLKLDNVMEHWSCNPDPENARSRVLVDSWPQFKLFDFGTAVVYPDPFSVKKAPVDAQMHMQPPAAADELTEEKQHGNSDKPGVITHSARDESFEYSEPYVCVRLYHMYWAKRGDVFRVMLALSKILDNKIWPIEDLEMVTLLLAVLERVTNSRRIRAQFEPCNVLLQRLRLGEYKYQHYHGGAVEQQQQQLAGHRHQQQRKEPAGLQEYSVTGQQRQQGGLHSALANGTNSEVEAAAVRAGVDIGCAVDPAAEVVKNHPVAPAEVQSVLGSRKALKGVTAAQLLAEPVVQNLLRRVH